MKVICNAKAPAAIGPYSQGFIVNHMVYTSGQTPVNPDTGKAPEGIAAQADQTCKNVGAVLDAAGSSLKKCLRQLAFYQISMISRHSTKSMLNTSLPNQQEVV